MESGIPYEEEKIDCTQSGLTHQYQEQRWECLSASSPQTPTRCSCCDNTALQGRLDTSAPTDGFSRTAWRDVEQGRSTQQTSQKLLHLPEIINDISST